MEENDRAPDAKPSSAPREKQVYGDYEIVRPIGKGKFAIVYRAQRISDGEIVALKRISVDAIDAKARDKCLKEVGLLQSLDHPNIIRYLDSFISDDDLVIVVEWAAAGDLKRQLRKAQEKSTPFEERIIWKYFSQIADAIKHMHERRVMHRDLKPANIFLTLDGTIKVGDLGLSRELSEHTVQAHSKVGTPLYMSPEVLRGDGYDFSSDTWSLGCLLYELAMLKSPFKAEGLNLYSLFQKISQGDYQPLPDDYSEDLRNLAYVMMSTKPEDRPELTDVCAVASRMRMKYQDSHQKSKRSKGFSGSKDNGTKIVRDESKAEETKVAYGVERDRLDDRERDDDFPVDNSPPQAAPKDNNKYSDRAQYQNSNNDIKNSAQPSANAETDQPSLPASKFQRFGPTTQSPAASNNYEFNNSRSTGGGAGGALQSAAVPVPAKQIKTQENVQRRVKPQEQKTSHQASGGSSITRRLLAKQSFQSSQKEVSDVDGERYDEQLSMDNDPMLDPSKRPPSSERNSTKQNAMVAALKDSSSAYSSMSSLYDKLIILNFSPSSVSEEEYVILPYQFAVDLTAVGLANRRSFIPAGSSFDYFVSVASWLFKKIESAGKGYRAPNFDVEHDPPLAVAKHILLETQGAGISPKELTDIAATSLLPGVGLKVCILLNLLADRAVSASNHKWKPFVYETKGGGDEALEPDAGLDDDDEIADEALDASNQYELDAESKRAGEGINGRSLGPSEGFLGQSMIMPDPSVKPSEWMAETERVTSKLLAKRTEKTSGGWQENLANLSTHAKVSNISGTSGGGENVIESIRLLTIQLDDSIKALSRVEGQFNTKQSTEIVRNQYRDFQVEYLTLEGKQKGVADKVASLTNTLMDITEMVDDLLEQVNGRSSGDGDGADNSVVKVRTAIKTLKAQIVEMDTTIGLLCAQLLKRRVQTVSRRLKREGEKRKSRLMLHGVKALSTSFGADEIDSDSA